MDNLSIHDTGPGAKMAGARSIIMQNMLRLAMNQYSMQQEQTNFQTSAAGSEVKTIRQSYDLQGDQIEKQALGEIMGSVASIAGLGAGLAQGAYASRQATKCQNALKNTQAFRLAANPGGSQVQVQPAGSPPEPISGDNCRKFFSKRNSDLEQDSQTFLTQLNNGQTRIGDLKSKSLGLNQADSQALEGDINRLTQKIESDLEGYKLLSQNTMQNSIQYSQVLNSLTKGICDSTAAELKREDGEQVALQTLYRFAADIARQCRDMSTKGCDSALQQVQNIFQTLENSIYANAGYRG